MVKEDSGKAKKAKADFLNLANKFGKKATSVATGVGSAVGKTVDTVRGAEKAVIDKLDQNGNGQIDIEDVIILGLRTPGVRIDREKFLRKEFKNRLSEENVDLVVETNPAKAKVPSGVVDEVADAVIKFERIQVSGISAALGTPGGAAMVATIPADIIQYYGYMLRAAQELMYLYGFPEIDIDGNGEILDAETMNTLILCMGVMYGVAGANNAIKSVARALASGVEKQLLKKALTKGTIYPIVKSVSKWFGVNMTKQIFAGFFKKAIPLVAGAIGGGLTFFSFKPCCDKLKRTLQDTMLSNPDYSSGSGEDELIVVE